MSDLNRPAADPYAAPGSAVAVEQPSIEMPGIGRLIYFLILFGLSMLSGVFQSGLLGISFNAVMAGSVAVLLVNMAVCSFRMRNIGWSGWRALFLIVPIANLYIGLTALILPPGYARSRTLDMPAKIICGVLLAIVALVVLAAVFA